MSITSSPFTSKYSLWVISESFTAIIYKLYFNMRWDIGIEFFFQKII